MSSINVSLGLMKESPTNLEKLLELNEFDIKYIHTLLSVDSNPKFVVDLIKRKSEGELPDLDDIEIENVQKKTRTVVVESLIKDEQQQKFYGISEENLGELTKMFNANESENLIKRVTEIVNLKKKDSERVEIKMTNSAITKGDATRLNKLYNRVILPETFNVLNLLTVFHNKDTLEYVCGMEIKEGDGQFYMLANKDKVLRLAVKTAFTYLRKMEKKSENLDFIEIKNCFELAGVFLKQNYEVTGIKNFKFNKARYDPTRFVEFEALFI